MLFIRINIIDMLTDRNSILLIILGWVLAGLFSRLGRVCRMSFHFEKNGLLGYRFTAAWREVA